MARILVADDDAAVRGGIRRLLEAAGHDVEETAEGSEALRLQRERPSDLLLVDLYMPGMDGMETIIRLKAADPDVKIVALSGGGYRDKDDVLAMALKAGANGTLTKPFERTDLLETISLALGPKQVRQHADPGASARLRDSPQQQGNGSPAKGTVLLVDDNEQARSILGKRLESAGYAVVGASDAEGALRLFQASPTDLVIADLILPDRSGAELIAALRAERPTVGIVAISGASGLLAAVSRDFADRGGFRSLAKPFTTPQLLEAIEAVLPRNQQPPSLGARLRGVLRFLRRGRRPQENQPASPDQ